MKHDLILCLLGTFLLFGSGCGKPAGPSLSPVGGTITYNGSPLARVNICFTPESGPAAFGTTGDDGTFTLKTNGQSGAVSGKHTISVSSADPPPMPGTPEAKDPPKSKLPEKYANATTSGLTATVPTDGKPVDLSLKD